MPEVNFEKTLPQADVEKVAEAARIHVETPEGKEMNGEELARKAIQTASQTIPQSGTKPGSLNVLTDYATQAPEEVKKKIEGLLSLAANKGLAEATAQARKESPFVLDAFHDALAAKLYPYLKEKGILK